MKIQFKSIATLLVFFATSCNPNVEPENADVPSKIPSSLKTTGICGLPSGGYCADLATAKFNLACPNGSAKDWSGVNNVISPYWYDNASAKGWKVSKNYADVKNRTLVLFGTTSTYTTGHVAVAVGPVVKEAIKDSKGKITGYKDMLTVVEYNSGTPRISNSKDKATKKEEETCFVNNFITSTYGVETTCTFEVSKTRPGFGAIVGYIFPEKAKK